MVECPLLDLAHAGSVNNKVNILQCEKETNESKADELSWKTSFEVILAFGPFNFIH